MGSIRIAGVMFASEAPVDVARIVILIKPILYPLKIPGSKEPLLAGERKMTGHKMVRLHIDRCRS